jgi:hypothetical protein
MSNQESLKKEIFELGPEWQVEQAMRSPRRHSFQAKALRTPKTGGPSVFKGLRELLHLGLSEPMGCHRGEYIEEAGRQFRVLPRTIRSLQDFQYRMDDI